MVIGSGPQSPPHARTAEGGRPSLHGVLAGHRRCQSLVLDTLPFPPPDVMDKHSQRKGEPPWAGAGLTPGPVFRITVQCPQGRLLTDGRSQGRRGHLQSVPTGPLLDLGTSPADPVGGRLTTHPWSN